MKLTLPLVILMSSLIMAFSNIHYAIYMALSANVLINVKSEIRKESERRVRKIFLN